MSRARIEAARREELARRECEVGSIMQLAMNTLDRSLEEIRNTHRIAKRLATSIDALGANQHLRLVSLGK